MDTRMLSVFFQVGTLKSADVFGFHIERLLGKAAWADIEFRSPVYVEPDEILALPACITLSRDKVDQEFHGVVLSVSMVTSPEHSEQEHLVYRIQMASVLGLLEHEVDCRIFQDLDIKEIVATVLRDLGIEDKRQVWRLSATYPKREYCVQYNESALAFISRLLEEEGIYFFSDMNDGSECLVFADNSENGDPIDGEKKLIYRHNAGLSAMSEAVSVIKQRYRTASGKVTFRDYNPLKPDLDLTVSASADKDEDLELYDYPSLYSTKAVGAQLAQVRLEALQAERMVLEIESDCHRISAGRWITLEETPNELDGDYFVTGVTHVMRLGEYRVCAVVIPRKVKYRTPQKTPLPIIDGPQTAVVVAPEGAPEEEIYTDKYGRCKVKFHWDRYGKLDEHASCWMRVAQPQTSGSMILPRVGWEVVVEFLEGNPARPFVTGRIFNGRHMPPYALPEGKSRTSLKTQASPGGKGTNEIRMEDKAGGEEIRIAAHKNTTLATANNKKTTTASNETKNVKANSTLNIGTDETVKISKGFKNTVGGAQTVSVGGDRKVEVNAVYALTSGGASKTSVAKNQFEMDGNPINALLSLAVKAATEAAKAEAEKALQNLDQVVSQKVDQLMGPIKDIQDQVNELSSAMDAVGRGNLGATGDVMNAASSLPSLDGFTSSFDNMSSQTGLDALVKGAIDAGAGKLGEALGLDGAGGGGSSLANKGGPEGAVEGNSAANNTTGPGHAINVCSSTHTEKVGSVKATIAAAGIHTTVKTGRTQEVGLARIELVGGTRAESCAQNKTEKALGLAVISKAAESEDVSGTRTTMVGGAVLEKIDGSHSITASGKAMFVGAYHKIDAAGAIVFRCGDSEVVIDGGGVAIKAAAVTITAPKVTLKKNVSQI